MIILDEFNHSLNYSLLKLFFQLYYVENQSYLIENIFRINKIINCKKKDTRFILLYNYN